MKLKGILAAAVALAIAAPAAQADTQPSVYTPAPSITYQGGPVQTDPTVYLVFWGGYWNTPAAQPEIQAEQQLFQQIGTSPYIGLLAEYGVHSEHYGGTFIDPAAPAGAPYLTEVSDEVTHAQATLGTPDPANTQYVVFPQPGTNLTAFGSECAEHDVQWSGSYVYTVIMPFTDSQFSNCEYDYSADNGHRAEDLVDADTSIASHEFVEMATDPDGGAWITSTGEVELADECAWYSGTPTGMTVNATYVWSVSQQACTLPTPTVQDQPPTPAGGSNAQPSRQHRPVAALSAGRALATLGHHPGADHRAHRERRRVRRRPQSRLSGHGRQGRIVTEAARAAL